jgi:hypothetical protein
MAVIATAVLSIPGEPHHGGRPLSRWLRVLVFPEQYGTSAAPGLQRREAIEAVQSLGTNSIPWLLKWIVHQEAPPDSRILIGELQARLPRPFTSRGSQFRAGNDPWLHTAAGCVSAFKALGPEATGAIAPLVGIAEDPRNPGAQNRALKALGRIGQPAVPAIMGLAARGSSPVRARAVSALALLGEDASPAVGLLISLLNDPDEGVAVASANTLGRLRLAPDEVLPALSRAAFDNRTMVRETSLFSMLEYEGEAKPWLEQIRGATVGSSPCTNLTSRITEAFGATGAD